MTKAAELLKLLPEEDGTTASLGAIPTGVVNIVDPVADAAKKKRKKRRKVPEAKRFLFFYGMNFPMDELVHLPIPFLTTEEHAIAKALAAEPKLQKKIPLETVKVDDLEPTQWRMDQKNINRLAKEGIFNGSLVFKRRGRWFIFDGHHRTEAARKEEKDSVRSRVIELDGERPLSVESFCRRYGISKEDLIAAMDSQDRIQFEKQP